MKTVLGVICALFIIFLVIAGGMSIIAGIVGSTPHLILGVILIALAIALPFLYFKMIEGDNS